MRVYYSDIVIMQWSMKSRKIFSFNWEIIQFLSKFSHSFRKNTIMMRIIRYSESKISRITSQFYELNVWATWFLFKHSTWHYRMILIDSSKCNWIQWHSKLNISFFATKFRRKCFCITMKFSFWIAFTKSIDITYFWSLKLKSRV